MAKKKSESKKCAKKTCSAKKTCNKKCKSSCAARKDDVVEFAPQSKTNYFFELIKKAFGRS
jgi:hypothetical protein